MTGKHVGRYADLVSNQRSVHKKHRWISNFLIHQRYSKYL